MRQCTVFLSYRSYTVCLRKQNLWCLIITQANVDKFSFFYIYDKMYYISVVKKSTSPKHINTFCWNFNIKMLPIQQKKTVIVAIFSMRHWITNYVKMCTYLFISFHFHLSTLHFTLLFMNNKRILPIFEDRFGSIVEFSKKKFKKLQR